MMSAFFRKKIRRVVIVFRDQSVEPYAKESSRWLKKRGISSQSFCQSSLGKKTLGKTADLILILGGDGTYLSAVRFARKKTIPMLGVNMGSLGFLTVHFKEKLYECLEQTLKGKMMIDERPLIQAHIEQKGKRLNSPVLALNDVVIERGRISQLIDIHVFLKNKPIYSLKADGLILSTATGSTAYSLAAGGPILYPKVRAFVATPICPHSLTHRPVLFPDNMTLKFQIKNTVQKVLLTVDGREYGRLSHLSSVVIQKSARTHQALKDSRHSNFLFLKDKLNFFERSI